MGIAAPWYLCSAVFTRDPVDESASVPKRASDCEFFTRVDEQLIAINKPCNREPIVSPIADQVVNEGALLTLPVSASDPDGDPITLTAANLPPGASFIDNGSGSGTLSYTPGFDVVPSRALVR